MIGLQVSIFICQIFFQYDIHDRTQQQAGANADYEQSNIERKFGR